MRGTRILITALIAIAIILFSVLIVLLFHPFSNETRVDTERQHPIENTSPVAEPSFDEEPSPVSQETATTNVSSGTDLYMEFPILEE